MSKRLRVKMPARLGTWRGSEGGRGLVISKMCQDCLPPCKTARWRRREWIRTFPSSMPAIPFCLPFSSPYFIPPSLPSCWRCFIPPYDGRRRRQHRFPGDFMDLHSPHWRTHRDRAHMTSEVCAKKCALPLKSVK